VHMPKRFEKPLKFFSCLSVELPDIHDVLLVPVVS